jgi:hypothetical protein
LKPLTVAWRRVDRDAGDRPAVVSRDIHSHRLVGLGAGTIVHRHWLGLRHRECLRLLAGEILGIGGATVKLKLPVPAFKARPVGKLPALIA